MGKAKPLKVTTWSDAELLLAAFAEERAAWERARAEEEAELAQVRARHAPGLQQREAEIEETAGALKQFAKMHRREFVAKEEGGEGRVREIHGVEFGYRLAPPHVRIPKKKIEEALAWLEEFGGDTYVRRAPEIARDRLKADLVDAQARHDAAFLQKFAAHHITLEQDEDFVLEVVPAT